MESIREENVAGREDERLREKLHEKYKKLQCEQAMEGLGQSAVWRQRGLICPKGSSA